MPVLGLETNACKRSACAVQSCLAESNWDEKECAWAIERLKKCCSSPQGRDSVHCSFRASTPAAAEAEPTSAEQQPQSGAQPQQPAEQPGQQHAWMPPAAEQQPSMSPPPLQQQEQQEQPQQLRPAEPQRAAIDDT